MLINIDISKTETIKKFENIYKATTGKEIYNYLLAFYLSFKSSKFKKEELNYISNYFRNYHSYEVNDLSKNIGYISKKNTIAYLLSNFIGSAIHCSSIRMFEDAVSQTISVFKDIKDSTTSYTQITNEEILEILEYPHIKELKNVLNPFNILRIDGFNEDIMSTFFPQNSSLLVYSPPKNNRLIIKHDFIYQLGNILSHTMTNDYFGIPVPFIDTFEKALNLKNGTVAIEDTFSIFCDCFVMSMLKKSPMEDAEPLHKKISQSAVDMICGYFYKIVKTL